MYSLRKRIEKRCCEDANIASAKENTNPNPPLKKPVRDQAAINKRHAEKRREKQQCLEEQVFLLKLEKQKLEQEVKRLNIECLRKEEKCAMQKFHFTRTVPVEDVLLGSKYEWALDLKAKGMPFVRKETDNASVLQMVGSAIVALLAVIMSKTQPITRLKVLCRVIFGGYLFGVQETKLVLHQLARDYGRNEVYKPWKILKAMDLAPKGSLNYRGIETLRRAEGLQKWELGFLPSRSNLQEKARRMYEVGQTVCPIKHTPSELGEMFIFDYEPTLRLILKTFQLDEIAQRESIEIVITLDGAELCDYLTHLTAGIKIVDRRAIDPRTGRPLCSHTEDLLGSAFACQSRNFCFIMKSLIGKDTKEAYAEFSDFFKFFEKVKNEGLPASVHGPRLCKMLVWSSQDMSSLWKCLKTGTGARKKCNSYFCHLCPCNSKDILFHTVGENRCNRCKRNGKAKCYHWDVGDEDSIEKFQQDLELHMEEYFETCSTTLDQVIEKSKIRYQPNALDKESDMQNIDFSPSTDDDDMDALYYFSSLITEELKLRNMPVNGTLAERRERLKQKLVVEEKLLLIKRAIERSAHGKDAALMLIKQAIICIMHLENRTGEKILTMLLSIGVELYLKRRVGANLNSYIAEIERIASRVILGTQWRPKQWKVPMKENGEELASISLSNTKTRSFMTEIQPLLDFIFQHPDDIHLRDEWHQLMLCYNEAMELLRKPTDFTDEEIEEFQSLIDSFYEKWIALVGVKGITNYIHMLGSGHVHYYLTVHRNLYKFSQQNWESLNEKMKMTYFRSTQRGGHYGGKDTPENERYYLLSVLKVFQRELLWLSGVGDEIFNDL